MADSDIVYPSCPEENTLQDRADMDSVYRNVGNTCFDSCAVTGSLTGDVLDFQMSDDLMVEKPAYQKGRPAPPVRGVAVPALTRKQNVSSFSLQIPEYISSERSFSPIASQLPVYGLDDLFQLASTHVRVAAGLPIGASSNDRHAITEQGVFNAVNAYLKEYESRISHCTEECLLGGESPRGNWKCSAGKLGEDFSHTNEYVSFSIQCYHDANDGGIIVEWQRRRGNARLFNMIFQHFSRAFDSMLMAAGAEAGLMSLNTVPNLVLGHMALAVGNVQQLADPAAEIISLPCHKLGGEKLTKLISPTGPIDAMHMMFYE